MANCFKQIIAPGSYVTLHQVGLAESLTPATFRTRSCMFQAETPGSYEPFKYSERKLQNGADSEGKEGEDDVQANAEYTLDHFTEEGAVWPIVEGRIVNWNCFRALMTHVHRSMSPHLHSPILLVAQPCWTARDLEKITQFFFETFKPPGFVIVDSALCSLWAYASVNACVIDVGYQKTDVTAITEFAISNPGRGIALPHTGGDAITQKLYSLLKSKDFTPHMCEALKRSAIYEVLPPGTPLPGATAPSADNITNPASAAFTGAPGSGPGQRTNAASFGETLANSQADDGKDEIEADGVLDVASIVAAGNKKMEEFLAKKDKEKAEKQAKKRGGAAEALSAPKTTKLRNADKERATFAYEQRIISHTPAADGSNGEAANGEANGTYEVEESGSYATFDANTHLVGAEAPVYSKTDVEAGVERLQGADDMLELIADAVHLAISSVDDVSKRSECWDSLILVGNGSKVRGMHLLLTCRKYIKLSRIS
jgi:actin-related protein 9